MFVNFVSKEIFKNIVLKKYNKFHWNCLVFEIFCHFPQKDFKFFIDFKNNKRGQNFLVVFLSRSRNC